VYLRRGPTAFPPVDKLIGAFITPQWPLIRHSSAAIGQRLGECLRFGVVSLRGQAVQMSATKQFNLTEGEIAAILRALRVRINDLHRLADNVDATDDPGDLRKQAVDLSILHDKLAAGS
jgi:hypothetical protein